MRRPTDDSRELVQAAILGIKRIYLPGYQLAKAGVMLLDLTSACVQQQELALEEDTGRDRSRLMQAMDVINQRWGKGTLHVASSGLAGPQRQWGMKQERRTPMYTTRWEDVPVARA